MHDDNSVKKFQRDGATLIDSRQMEDAQGVASEHAAVAGYLESDSISSVSSNDNEIASTENYELSNSRGKFHGVGKMLNQMISFVFEKPTDKPTQSSRQRAPNNSTDTYTTRPPTLPPKSPAEERMHRRQYEEMRSKYELSLRNCQIQKVKNLQIRQAKVNNSREQWKEVLDKWDDESLASSKIRHLVFKGIPPSFRCYAWPLLIGNKLNIQQSDYLKALSSSNNDENGSKSKITNLIHLDLIRTFPALAFYQVGGPSYAELKRVIECYVQYNPDIGYVQGMSYLVAILLLYMDEFQAFCSLVNLLDRDLQKSFYFLESSRLDYYIGIFDSAFSHYLPKLHAYLLKIGMQHNIFLLDWVLTIFSKSLSLDVATRVWDIYLLEGDAAIIRVSLTILKILQHEILSQNLDIECCQKLLSKAHNIDEAGFFNVMSTIKCKNFLSTLLS